MGPYDLLNQISGSGWWDCVKFGLPKFWKKGKLAALLSLLIKQSGNQPKMDETFMTQELTHLDFHGNAHMVDPGNKPVTLRVAVAQAIVLMNRKTLDLLKAADLPKGDAFAVAKTGAILAAKRVDELIPLCHTLPLDNVEISFEVLEDKPGIRILAETRCQGRTGVEMEAIIAAQMAAAIIYDMCKAVQRDMVIADVRLLYKNGGKSGEFRAPGFQG